MEARSYVCVAVEAIDGIRQAFIMSVTTIATRRVFIVDMKRNLGEKCNNSRGHQIKFGSEIATLIGIQFFQMIQEKLRRSVARLGQLLEAEGCVFKSQRTQDYHSLDKLFLLQENAR